MIKVRPWPIGICNSPFNTATKTPGHGRRNAVLGERNQDRAARGEIVGEGERHRRRQQMGTKGIQGRSEGE